MSTEIDSATNSAIWQKLEEQSLLILNTTPGNFTYGTAWTDYQSAIAKRDGMALMYSMIDGMPFEDVVDYATRRAINIKAAELAAESVVSSTDVGVSL